MRRDAMIAAMLASLLAASAALADDYVIEHVTLLDGIHAPQSDMTVSVKNDRIESVVPSGVAHELKGHRIDGKGKYLMPGLMDVHIHLKGGFDITGKVNAELD